MNNYINQLSCCYSEHRNRVSGPLEQTIMYIYSGQKKRNAAMYEKCLLYQLCISLKKNRQLLEKLEQNGARECSLPVSQFIKTLVQPRVP